MGDFCRFAIALFLRATSVHSSSFFLSARTTPHNTAQLVPARRFKSTPHDQETRRPIDKTTERQNDRETKRPRDKMTERQSEQGTRPSEARPRNKDQEIIPRDYQETIPRDSTKRQYQKTISGDKTKEETRPIDKIK